MNYVSYINQLIKEKLSKTKFVVSFGQNVSTGSCLSGLTRNLPTDNGNLVINTTNSEYTLTGAGFGLMVENTNGIFFLKQQDFLLLGIDHLVHTWNAMRTRELEGSFTIVAIVVDNGFEGPQSCINNLADLCSIAKIPGYTISNKVDAEAVINQHLVAPGVRFIGVSQSLFRAETDDLAPQGVMLDADNVISQYGSGDGLTIVSVNFAFGQAIKLYNELNEAGISSSVFNVSNLCPTTWDSIIEHASKTQHVVICDDSKGIHKASTQLANALRDRFNECKVLIEDRKYQDQWSWPHADKYTIQPKIIRKWFNG